MQSKLKISGYRPTFAAGIFRAIAGRANEPRSMYCVEAGQKYRQYKAPNL
jgi:hypothetical protein